MAILPFFQLPNASRSGAFEAAPSSFIFLKAGLSFICRRIYSEINKSTIDPKNGMRQPQALNAFIIEGEPSASITALPAASSTGMSG